MQLALDGTQGRRPTEHFRTPLHRHGVLEMEDVNDLTGFIPHIDMVAQINPACVANAGSDHRARLKTRMGYRCLQVPQIPAFSVESVNIVVKIEEVARHVAENARAGA